MVYLKPKQLIIKDCARRFVLKLYRHEASRGLFATAELLVLYLVSHFNFLFIPCGGLRWLPVSFLLHIKYTLSYRIVSYINVSISWHWTVTFWLLKFSVCSTLLGSTKFESCVFNIVHELYSVSKTRPLRIIWYNFTNSQRLLIIFGRERPCSILNWYDEKF